MSWNKWLLKAADGRLSLLGNRQSAALARRADAVEAGTQYLGAGKTTPSRGRSAVEFEPMEYGEKIAFAKGSRGNIERVLGTKAIWWR